MSMQYIREFYGISVKRGDKVEYASKKGTVLGARYQYLKVRMDGEKRARFFHPTSLNLVG